jgi:hypothetical protein
MVVKHWYDVPTPTLPLKGRETYTNFFIRNAAVPPFPASTPHCEFLTTQRVILPVVPHSRHVSCSQ